MEGHMYSGGGNDVYAPEISMIRNPRTGTSKDKGWHQQPQWDPQETTELIRIRAELEKDFAAAKRSKTLWEIVSAKMREKSYHRTPEQCKCKWKNLINRYKGKETSDPENGRPCPFFEELHAVFTERAKSMQRLLLESEADANQTKKKVKKITADRSSIEFSEDEDEVEDDSEEEDMSVKSNPRKRKGEKFVRDKSSRTSNSSNNSNTIQEMLKEFFQHQQEMEMKWVEMMERRALERQLLEQEWRQSFEKLERERLMTEVAWRESEEQRRIREESRAERRDALLTTLLNKLIHENRISSG